MIYSSICTSKHIRVAVFELGLKKFPQKEFLFSYNPGISPGNPGMNTYIAKKLHVQLLKKY